MTKSSAQWRKTASELIAQASGIERDLAAIGRAMRQPIDSEVGNASITAPQKAVMLAVVRNPGVSLNELSVAVSLAHSTVSGIVDRLQQRGVIERRSDESDGRISRIYPSRELARFMKQNQTALQSGPLLACLHNVPAEERTKIAWAVQRLRELLEAE